MGNGISKGVKGQSLRGRPAHSQTVEIGHYVSNMRRYHAFFYRLIRLQPVGGLRIRPCVAVVGDATSMRGSLGRYTCGIGRSIRVVQHHNRTYTSYVVKRRPGGRYSLTKSAVMSYRGHPQGQNQHAIVSAHNIYVSGCGDDYPKATKICCGVPLDNANTTRKLLTMMAHSYRGWHRHPDGGRDAGRT